MTEENAAGKINELRFFDNIRDEETVALIQNAIKVNGYAPEHNYFELLSYDSKDSKPLFVYFGDGKGLFAVDYEDVWQVLSEILAPKGERADMFIQFADYLFKNKNVKKIMVEFPFELRKEISKKIRNKNRTLIDPAEKRLTVGDVVEHYYTPIINLEHWDPTLNGPDFSKLRKAKNRFFRTHKVEIIMNEDIANVPVKDIREMVIAWAKNRKARDRAAYDAYITFINNGCKGSALSLLIKIDDKVRGLASASLIPNSEKTVYYNINLHDYSIPELGDFLTVLFLDELKNAGFKFLNFGASDKRLLQYKEKFNPVSKYDSALFYVRYEPEKKRKEEKKIPVVEEKV
jgi:hypothetical protein